ncbi:hypothetical protein Ahy_B02g059801 isoform B [Arachis hypogaea]|uniref:RRM domain-containing protein n=1 Tax=Arachis hypogaea TaxID=3818 RepID=A0A445AH93_ARAHY|nr:hypothetical protein Ahy_B02g059801 isoform B [Arachis hypogaea]
MISLSFKAVCEDSSRVEKSIPPFTQQDQQQFVFRCSAAADVPLFLCLVPLLLSFTLPKRSRVSKNRMKDSVNYQIISPKDLAKSVLSSIIEFTREDVEALLNEKAKRKDRFNYKIKGVIKVGEATGRKFLFGLFCTVKWVGWPGCPKDQPICLKHHCMHCLKPFKTVSELMAQLNEKSFELEVKELTEESSYAKGLGSAAAVELKALSEEVSKLMNHNERLAAELAASKNSSSQRRTSGTVQNGRRQQDSLSFGEEIMAEEIRFFKLNTGAKIPSVGLGTFQAENPGALAKAASTAIKVGYGHIDCASSYGNQVELIIISLLNDYEFMILPLTCICSTMLQKRIFGHGGVMISGLDSSVSNDELKHIFGSYGEIKEVMDLDRRVRRGQERLAQESAKEKAVEEE